jgi:hypothetical protein
VKVPELFFISAVTLLQVELPCFLYEKLKATGSSTGPKFDTLPLNLNQSTPTEVVSKVFKVRELLEKLSLPPPTVFKVVVFTCKMEPYTVSVELEALALNSYSVPESRPETVRLKVLSFVKVTFSVTFHSDRPVSLYWMEAFASESFNSVMFPNASKDSVVIFSD